jgi:hypothetical protein
LRLRQRGEFYFFPINSSAIHISAGGESICLSLVRYGVSLGFMGKIFWFVLSKDRPLQLDALLRSMLEMVSEVYPCIVFYKSSNDQYSRAYAEVFERHKHMQLSSILEQSFRADVFRIINESHCERVAFLVDDQVFVAPVDMQKILTLDPNFATYSLRLGKRITYCQPLGTMTGNPPFLQLDGLPSDWLAWRWESGVGDWRGANCLDGNVLSRKMISKALDHPLGASIRGPQTLEMSLNGSGIVTKVGICSLEPQIVNLAINRVSEEAYLYPHGTLQADKLLEAWQSGYQLSLTKIRALATDSCHIICDLPLERREQH